jgi:hypothetical protein
MEAERLRKVFVVASIISGVAGAYLMYRRGASLTTIARRTLTSPVGTLANEIGTAVRARPAS